MVRIWAIPLRKARHAMKFILTFGGQILIAVAIIVIGFAIIGTLIYAVNY